MPGVVSVTVLGVPLMQVLSVTNWDFSELVSISCTIATDTLQYRQEETITNSEGMYIAS